MPVLPQPFARRTSYIDALFPVGATHVTPKELGGICGYSSQHILASIDRGHLGAFIVPGKGGGSAGGGRRMHARIPVEMARPYLVTNQTGLEDELILEQLTRAAARLPRALKMALSQEISRQTATGR